MPLSGRKVYDVRAVIDSIADAGSVLEASPKWAPNIVTAFARIEGGPVGIVANQPRYLGGVIDVAASQKGASFIRTCNQYGVPLVVLVDTPGFLPGLLAGVGGRDPARGDAAARVRGRAPSRASPSCCARRSAGPTSR